MRLLLFTFLFLNLFSMTAQTPHAILEGFLRDSITHEELIGASVKVTQNDTMVRGSISDFNGYYRIPLDAGVYNVQFTYTGYTISRINGVTMIAGQTTQQNALLSPGQKLPYRRYIYCFPPRLIDKSPGNTGFTFTSQMLRHAY